MDHLSVSVKAAVGEADWCCLSISMVGLTVDKSRGTGELSIDSQLTMLAHVSAVCQSARHCVSTAAPSHERCRPKPRIQLFIAIIPSRLDNCNSLLFRSFLQRL